MHFITKTMKYAIEIINETIATIKSIGLLLLNKITKKIDSIILGIINM